MYPRVWYWFIHIWCQCLSSFIVRGKLIDRFWTSSLIFLRWHCSPTLSFLFLSENSTKVAISVSSFIFMMPDHISMKNLVQDIIMISSLFVWILKRVFFFCIWASVEKVTSVNQWFPLTPLTAQRTIWLIEGFVPDDLFRVDNLDNFLGLWLQSLSSFSIISQ